MDGGGRGIQRSKPKKKLREQNGDGMKLLVCLSVCLLSVCLLSVCLPVHVLAWVPFFVHLSSLTWSHTFFLPSFLFSSLPKGKGKERERLMSVHLLLQEHRRRGKERAERQKEQKSQPHTPSFPSPISPIRGTQVDGRRRSLQQISQLIGMEAEGRSYTHTYMHTHTCTRTCKEELAGTREGGMKGKKVSEN
mmetsp:Transcript_32303/g.64132  ORF Transcript_32303/g.64132 Transcript_32303/m.64132 type:complete len:192 (-) Transcript_32303:190-765(-)